MILKRTMNDHFANDKFYIDIIKSSANSQQVNKAKESLYLKYLPLIKKVASTFGYRREDGEDFIGDSYFVFLSTLKYVKKDKINESFSFGHFFRFQLYNLAIQKVKESKRRAKKGIKMVSYENLVENNPAALNSLHAEEDALIAALFDDANIALDAIDKIPQTIIKPRDKEIIKEILKGHIPREVAETFDLSEQRIKGICKTHAEEVRALVV